MIWLFIVLGFSTLVVVCVAIALYVRVRSHWRAAETAKEGREPLEHESTDHL